MTKGIYFCTKIFSLVLDWQHLRHYVIWTKLHTDDEMIQQLGNLTKMRSLGIYKLKRTHCLKFCESIARMNRLFRLAKQILMKFSNWMISINSQVNFKTFNYMESWWIVCCECGSIYSLSALPKFWIDTYAKRALRKATINDITNLCISKRRLFEGWNIIDTLLLNQVVLVYWGVMYDQTMIQTREKMLSLIEDCLFYDLVFCNVTKCQ